MSVGDKGLWRTLAPGILRLGAFAVALTIGLKQAALGRPLTEAEINQALNQAAVITKQTLPKVIDPITTLTDVRVEGTNFIYMNVISEYEIEDKSD